MLFPSAFSPLPSALPQRQILMSTYLINKVNIKYRPTGLGNLTFAF
jgi:hypothetical protein